jgi:hypothetical protein
MASTTDSAAAPKSRRAFFSSAATAGVAATAVAAVLPRLNADNTSNTDTNALPPVPENGGGYSLSEHVKRYYQTAQV